MKKLIVIAVVLCCSFLVSSTARSQTPFCASGPKLHVIDPDTYGPASKTEFLNAIANYSNPADGNFNAANDRYELCFKFQGTHVYIDSTINIGANPLDKDLAIFGIIDDSNTDFGIHLHDSTPASKSVILVKEYNPGKKVSIENLHIKNAENGLNVYDSKVELINPLLAGVGGGSCIALEDSDGSIIRGGDISGCDIGIRLGGFSPPHALDSKALNTVIGAPVWDAFDDYTKIHENKVGIQLFQGYGNKWPYVSIYENQSNPPDKTSEDGISVEVGENDGIQAPVIVEQNGKIVVCDKDENGIILNRNFVFDNISEEGEITFYTVDSDAGFPQGKMYAARCNVDLEGNCEWADVNSNNSEMQLTNNQCGIDELFLTAIYTRQDGNSSPYITDLIDFGNYVVFATGTITQTTPESEVKPVVDSIELEDQGSQFSPELENQPTMPDPVSFASPAAGCGKSGASMLPNDIAKTVAPSLGLWWIIFSIGLIYYLRRKRSPVRISRRRK